MEKNNIEDEVTITPVIRDIERLVNRMVKFIWSLVRTIFAAIGMFFQFVFKNLVILMIVAVIGGLVGYFSVDFFPRKYTSSMVLKMNVDSKEQLQSDIDYLNALIDRNQDNRLEELLGITKEEAASLKNCELEPSATYVEKAEAVNMLYKSTDTALFDLINYEALLNSSSAELTAKFKLTFTATDQQVFEKLEKPLLNYLESSPELNRLLVVNQKALLLQRQTYVKELERLDTLSRVMNTTMIEHARTAVNSGSNTNISFGNEENEKNVSVLDLQDRYLFYTQQIIKVDKEIEEHQTCYFIESHLSPFGSKIGFGKLYRTLIGSVFTFLVVSLILLLFKWRKTVA